MDRVTYKQSHGHRDWAKIVCPHLSMWGIKKQEQQIVTRYALLTPGCNYPQNFITIASIVLEICTGQNSGMKINKGQ